MYEFGTYPLRSLGWISDTVRGLGALRVNKVKLLNKRKSGICFTGILRTNKKKGIRIRPLRCPRQTPMKQGVGRYP